MIPFQHGVFATSSAAASGFEAIATVTATGGETSLTFSSIPGTYASLQIRGIVGTTADGQSSVNLQFNSDTSANYANHNLEGNGSTTRATGGSSQTRIAWVNTQPYGTVTSALGASIIDIHDYASTTRNKTVRVFTGYDTNNAAEGWIRLVSGLWMSTAAVTSATLYSDNSYVFKAGSTFALYGIKGAA